MAQAAPPASRAVSALPTLRDLKIDGPVALIMAMARAMANVSNKSVYEGRGLLVFG